MDVYFQLIEYLRKKEKVALATVVETKGAAPQEAGSSALFSAEGLISGTVGGGLVEAEVERKTLQALKERRPRLLSFNLAKEITSAEGAVCGGEMRILIDPLPEKCGRVFRRLTQALSNRQSGILVTLLEKERLRRKYSLSRYWILKNKIILKIQKLFPDNFQSKIQEALSEGKPYFFKKENKRPSQKKRISFFYLEPHFPLARLIIAGAGHIGQAVAHLGKFLSFEVIVIDDRPEFANRERFPEADQIIVQDIGQTIRNFPMASDTYVVIATRDHSHDEQALRSCLKSWAGYIGMLGSSRKVQLMRERFLKKRWATPSEFDRVCAPIGIKIGSKTIAEIAVSIAAELVLVRSWRQG